MTESQTPAMDMQTTLAGILANMQMMREENKADMQSAKEDAIKQNKAPVSYTHLDVYKRQA